MDNLRMNHQGVSVSQDNQFMFLANVDPFFWVDLPVSCSEDHWPIFWVSFVLLWLKWPACPWSSSKLKCNVLNQQ